jgi:uncharacterized protein
VQFDQYTVTLLVLHPDAPQLDDQAAAALQDAHMAHLADLHEAGYLLATGPLLGEPNREFRGLVILNVSLERALELMQADPAVQAGRLIAKPMRWMAPSGAMSFSPTRFPRSMVEAEAA